MIDLTAAPATQNEQPDDGLHDDDGCRNSSNVTPGALHHDVPKVLSWRPSQLAGKRGLAL
jgi:hypothetical protein